MRKDFLFASEQLNNYGILRVSTDFYMEPKRKGMNYFVKSPHSEDRTWSLCLYPNTNRFTDYANCSYSGDIISFVAYIRNTDNWKALKELQAYYGLSSDGWGQDKQEIRRRILVQQEQERKKRQRQQAFKAALSACIDDLKRWEIIYKTVLKNGLYKPFSDVWCYVMNELQKVEYRLDILCCADQHTYRFMKNGSEYIASDYPQWILDTLDVLAEEGMFRASESELMQIRKRVNFEIVKPYGCKEKV